MGLADLVAPVAAAHGDDGELGQDDGPADGRGYLLGALHAQTHVPVVVTHRHKSLERRADTSTLSGPFRPALQQRSQTTKTRVFSFPRLLSVSRFL